MPREHGRNRRLFGCRDAAVVAPCTQHVGPVCKSPITQESGRGAKMRHPTAELVGGRAPFSWRSRSMRTRTSNEFTAICRPPSPQDGLPWLDRRPRAPQLGPLPPVRIGRRTKPRRAPDASPTRRVVQHPSTPLRPTPRAQPRRPGATRGRGCRAAPPTPPPRQNGVGRACRMAGRVAEEALLRGATPEPAADARRPMSTGGPTRPPASSPERWVNDGT